MPKANGPPREVLLWVTPASGRLPIFLPETAGPLKPPGVRTTGLRRTWVSSAKGAMVAEPIYIPTNTIGEFPFFHGLPSIYSL